MEVVKFVRSEENGGFRKLYFKLCDRLADYIRHWTEYEDDDLVRYLDDDNLFRYTISNTEDFDSFQQPLVETIESICNEYDDAYMHNHIITDNGNHRSPSEIHALMHTEYGLADINEMDNGTVDQRDIDLEWWTAHFFIALKQLIYEEPDELYEEDDEDGHDGGMIHTVASASEVSEFLKILKSIDTIFVVDDARKIGPEDINRLREEHATNKQTKE